MLSAFKNFAITLIIASVVFGVTAYFATQFVTATVSDIMGAEMSDLDEIISGSVNDQRQETDTDTETGTETETDSANTAVTEILGESFSFLVVCSGYRPELFTDYVPTVDVLKDKVASFTTAADSYGILSKNYREIEATTIVLVRADKEKQEFTYTYITPETRVHTTTGYHTLGEVYALYGYEYIGAFVRSLTGIAVDYTFLLEGYNMEEFIAQLGSVPVNNPKNIYAEGIYHTTRSETTRERVNENGDVIVDHYDNSMVLAAGNISFTEYASHILNTLKERSSAEIEMKGTYSVAIVESYVKTLANMSQEQFTSFMQKALAVPDPGNQPDEPATPILQSNFTEENIADVYDMIRAAALFSSSVIQYPGTYVQASDDTDAYFDPDINTAIKRFLPYRFH